MHARTALRRAFAALAMGLLLASCSWTSGDQYLIHWGGGRNDVIIRERTSWDLALARELFYANNDAIASQVGGFTCHANRSWRSASTCVMQLLDRVTAVPSLAGGVWRRALDAGSSARREDFHGAMARVHGSADDRGQVADCLTLSVYPHTTNWTQRDRTDVNCRLGRHVWQ